VVLRIELSGSKALPLELHPCTFAWLASELDPLASSFQVAEIMDMHHHAQLILSISSSKQNCYLATGGSSVSWFEHVQA
jgi:hypothetical protein